MRFFSKKLNTVSVASLVAITGTALFLASPAKADIGGCHGGTTIVCGATIPLPAVTPVGDTANVHIPASVLGDSYATNSNLFFTAQCIADQYGGAAYRVQDVDKIACSSFPCQASSVRLCDTSIPVSGGTPLGGVMHINMPAPFARSSFTVQCVGNLDNPPVYQITDHAGVSCTPVTGAP